MLRRMHYCIGIMIEIKLFNYNLIMRHIQIIANNLLEQGHPYPLAEAKGNDFIALLPPIINAIRCNAVK